MTIGNRGLRFEAAWDCTDCGSRLELRTYQAVVDGPGQICICGGCKRPYRVMRNGATKLPRDSQLLEVGGLPPLPTAYGLLQPPHRIQVLPFDTSRCYVCGVLVDTHPREPELFIPGGKPEGM